MGNVSYDVLLCAICCIDSMLFFEIKCCNFPDWETDSEFHDINLAQFFSRRLNRHGSPLDIL